MSSRIATQSFSVYTNTFFEVLVAILTFAPILILIYFYQALPEQIPVFLNLRGEVEVWAPRSIASVFRVPAKGANLQLICLLMKYGTVKSQRSAALPGVDQMSFDYQNRVTVLSARFWDGLRCLVGIKMAAASLEVVFMSVVGLRFLWTPAWVMTWVAAILSILAAAWYGYRLWQVKREMAASGIGWKAVENQRRQVQLFAGLLYCNTKDPAMFVDKYLFNFGNKWTYVLLACIVAYPLLVFAAT